MRAVTDEKMQMRWCYPFPDIHAFGSHKKARKYTKNRFGVDVAKSTSGWTDSFINDETNDVVCIVALKKKGTPAERFALLAHECCHVVKQWLDMMGCEEPDEEMVANGVQCAMLACINQIGEEWFLL